MEGRPAPVSTAQARIQHDQPWSITHTPNTAIGHYILSRYCVSSSVNQGSDDSNGYLGGDWLAYSCAVSGLRCNIKSLAKL